MKKKIILLLCATLFSSITNFAQVNLSAGLVAHWDFNGSANDVSGNGNNGLVFGASLTTGQAGMPNTAYLFNGSSNYIQVPNSANLNFPNDSFTLYALVKPQGFYTGSCHGNIIIDKNGDYNPGWYSLRFSDAYSSSFTNCNSPVNTTQQNFNSHQYNMIPSGGGYVPYINLNEWYCLVSVCDGSTIKLYVNGALVQTQSLSGSLGTNTADLFIGRLNSNAYPYWFNGVIDEIRMYNRAVNIAEVNVLCSCQSAPPVSNAILSNDTSVCAGTGVQLQTNPLINPNSMFTWYPTTSLNDSTSLNPIATPSTATTYYLNILNPGCNQIVNGDFEAGNVSFSSQYSYTSINTIEGEYYVGDNPQLWNGALGAYGDHTSGTGNMMIVNGAPTPNTNVWCSTVTVNPGQDYAFSAWLMNANQNGIGSNPPTLQFSINGNLIGTPFTASINGGVWQPFFQTWNSGANTTATICIVNQNTQAAGNDFALDDISFSSYSWQSDSVNISMSPSPVLLAGPDTSVCSGSLIQLTASGTSSYVWSPAVSLNNINIANPIASPTTTTNYTVTGSNAGGCSSTATVMVSMLPAPIINVSATPTAVCQGYPTQLTASSSSPINWSGGIVNGVSFVPSSTSTYTVTSTNAIGCTSSATITVPVNPIPTVMAIANPSTVCLGSTTTLNGNGATNYTWSGGVINGVIFSPATAGTYTVTGTDANGCSNTSSVSISLLPSPIVTAIVDHPIICQGDPVIFTGNGANSYTWSGGVLNGISFFPASNTVYTVTGSDANGCSATSTVSVLVHPSPIVSGMAAPAVICEGKSSTLIGSGALTYSWSGGQTNGIPFFPLTTNTYTVIGTDAFGCTNTNTVTLSVTPPLSILIINSTPLLCQGDSSLLVASGALNYSWSPNYGLSANSNDSVFANPNSTTLYTVHATDVNGCTGTALTLVEVTSQIDVTASKSKDIECNGNIVQLSATGAQNYSWSPASLLSQPNNAVTSAQIENTTTFYVTGSLGSCTDLDSVTVQVINSDASSIFIPTAFSPNNDNVNDCFQLAYKEKYSKFYFTIYNRWGQKVFESNSQNFCWDGSLNSMPQMVGTYYYYLQIESNCGKVIRKGDLLLIR